METVEPFLDALVVRWFGKWSHKEIKLWYFSLALFPSSHEIQFLAVVHRKPF